MTGEPAEDDAIVEVTVHKVNYVALKTRRKPYPMLMVSYVCTTDLGVKLDATLFV